MPQTQERPPDGWTPAERAPDGDLRSDVRLLSYQVAQLDKKFDQLQANFATKAELADVREDVAGLKSGVWWVVKIVGGFILVAVLSLVIIKGGGPHL